MLITASRKVMGVQFWTIQKGIVIKFDDPQQEHQSVCTFQGSWSLILDCRNIHILLMASRRSYVSIIGPAALVKQLVLRSNIEESG